MRWERYKGYKVVRQPKKVWITVMERVPHKTHQEQRYRYDVYRPDGTALTPAWSLEECRYWINEDIRIRKEQQEAQE